MSTVADNDLRREIENMLQQLPPADWVTKMIDHYNRTGTYRARICAPLGRPHRAVEVGPDISLTQRARTQGQVLSGSLACGSLTVVSAACRPAGRSRGAWRWALARGGGGVSLRRAARARSCLSRLPTHQPEIQLAPLQVHPGDGHAHHVAQPELVARAVAGQPVGRAVVAVVVVGQGVDVDQPSAGSRMPWANSPKVSTPGNHGVHLLADPGAQVAQSLSFVSSRSAASARCSLASSARPDDQLAHRRQRSPALCLLLPASTASMSRWMVRSG